MPDNNEQTIQSDVVPAMPGESAVNDTQPNTSMRTTVPDIAPVIAGASTQGQRHDGTAPYGPSAGASGASVASHSSFSGLLGRFHYVRTLGEGAFGVVVQVWDPELQKHRAIKVPHRDLIESGRVNPESYVREARKLAQLGDHPGIVDVLDVQRMENGTPFVVSEFIAGGSLAERVKGSRMPWRDAVQLIIQVAEAIGHAHSKGVVHRDLKPANIMLTDEGKPVVVDFGLALGDEEFSYQTSVCGTYQYMSPQQLRGEADRVDGRADTYSLGVILYQLVAGRVPYKSRDVKSLKHEILKDEPTPLRQYNPQAPVELQEICHKAMSKELGNRYSTAGDFAAALRDVLNDNGDVHPTTTASASKPSRWVRIAALAVGCSLLGFGLFTLLGLRSEPHLLPVTAASATPNLQIHFQKANQRTFDRSLADADLPLEVGDKLQFQIARLPKPMYAYIYWINADGSPIRVWPSGDTQLSEQVPIEQLTSPPAPDADAVEQSWWEIQSAGGPLVFFLGLSDKKLDEQQLNGFETRSALMRDSLMSTLERSGRSIAEFEFPEQTKAYELRNDELYRTRGGNLHLVISPKVYATDHSQLQEWFSAYHGWIVAAKK